MNVAIFTDNDFDKINGVTTTLTAALRYVPEGLRLRVYTAATLAVDTPDYLAVRSLGMPIPFYRDMRMYLPRFFEFVARARADRIDVIHLTTPGPGRARRAVRGLAAAAADGRQLSHRPGGVYDPAERIGAARLADARIHAMAVRQVRQDSRALVPYPPSAHRRRKTDPNKVDLWPRGVDTVALQSGAAVSDLARQLARVESAAGVALRRPRLEGKAAADAPARCRIGSTRSASSTGSSSSAAGRCCRSFRRACPTRSSRARSRATPWPRPLPRRTSSCSPAAPTRRATSCSKRRPAACR